MALNCVHTRVFSGVYPIHPVSSLWFVRVPVRFGVVVSISQALWSCKREKSFASRCGASLRFTGGMWWVFAHGVGARRMIRYVISITLPTKTFPLWHSVSPACAKYHIVPAMASNRCAHTNSNDYEEICSPVHAHQTYEPTRMNQTDTPDKTSWKSVVLSFFQFVQGVFHQSACK